MYLAMIHAGTYVYAPQGVNGVQMTEYETVAAAKKAITDYMARNKTAFLYGYNAYVIDQETRKVVSSASIPQPTFEWKDA